MQLQLPNRLHDKENQNPNKRARKKNKRWKCKRTRAYLKIASLNINGAGSTQTQSKWEHINQIIRDDKIDILAVQETHLIPERVDNLTMRYPRLHIINSHDPNQSNAKGVAIIMNKHRTRWQETRSTEIIPGRAMMVTTPWKQDETLNILAIYAPNDAESQISFWNDVQRYLEDNTEIPKPDIMLGDFNVVENKSDRDPPNRDPQAVVESLQNFRLNYDLQDVWRNENPNELTFTYIQFQNTTKKSQSRIDRVYLKGDLANMCYEWNFRHSGITSDHKLVSFKLEDPKMPFIGKGRWAMPLFSINDPTLMRTIKEIGHEKLLKLTRASEENESLTKIEPQIIHEEFKQEIQKLVREYTKKTKPKIDRLI
ncbi:Endonuclease/exonuclease/phosphatase, partial [Panaeolus papilionaceus]